MPPQQPVDGGRNRLRYALSVLRQLNLPIEADLSDPRFIAEAVRDALNLSPSPDLEPLEQVVAAFNRPLVVPPLGGESAKWTHPRGE